MFFRLASPGLRGGQVDMHSFFSRIWSFVVIYQSVVVWCSFDWRVPASEGERSTCTAFYLEFGRLNGTVPDDEIQPG